MASEKEAREAAKRWRRAVPSNWSATSNRMDEHRGEKVKFRSVSPGGHWVLTLDSLHGVPNNWRVVLDEKHGGTYEVQNIAVAAGIERTVRELLDAHYRPSPYVEEPGAGEDFRLFDDLGL